MWKWKRLVKPFVWGVFGGLALVVFSLASTLLVIYLRDDRGWEEQMARSSHLAEWWGLIFVMRFVPFFAVCLLTLAIGRKKIEKGTLLGLFLDLSTAALFFSLAGITSDPHVTLLLRSVNLDLSVWFYALSLGWIGVLAARVQSAVSGRRLVTNPGAGS